MGLATTNALSFETNVHQGSMSLRFLCFSMTARDALWMDHAAYNTAQRNVLLSANGTMNSGTISNGNSGSSAMIFNDLRIQTGIDPMTGEPAAYYSDGPPAYAGANPELIRATLARQVIKWKFNRT